MIADVLWITVGLGLLLAGGDVLVRGAAAAAVSLRMSPLLIGLTVVGFGTSTPELLVSLDAAWRNRPDIAIGNVVGSNIANILLILGLAVLIRPLKAPAAARRRDGPAMLLATLALIIPFVSGNLGRGTGAVLLLGLVAYIVLSIRTGYAAPALQEALAPEPLSGRWKLAMLIGLAGLVLGARLLVDGATDLARGTGVSEAFIGLTVVAVGTSLPEMVTSVIAALRRQSDIALGNILGSNIFNALGILGVSALVAPIPVAPRFAAFDLPVALTVTAGLAVLLLIRGRVGRGWGIAMLLAYGAYLASAPA